MIEIYFGIDLHAGSNLRELYLSKLQIALPINLQHLTTFSSRVLNTSWTGNITLLLQLFLSAMSLILSAVRLLSVPLSLLCTLRAFF